MLYILWKICKGISSLGLSRWLNGEESACQVGDEGWIPGSERSSGEGNLNPLQYSGLENSMEVHGVSKNQTCLSDFRFTSILFISVGLFLRSSRSLVNISCIFSIFASILFPRCWVNFTIIILNSFSGILPISTSFSCFPGVWSCPFIWTQLSAFSCWLTFCNVVFVLVTVWLWFFLLVLALWWRRLRGLCKLPDGRDWWWEKLGLSLVGRALLSKTSIQISDDGWGFLAWGDPAFIGLWVLCLG